MGKRLTVEQIIKTHDYAVALHDIYSMELKRYQDSVRGICKDGMRGFEEKLTKLALRTERIVRKTEKKINSLKERLN